MTTTTQRYAQSQSHIYHTYRLLSLPVRADSNMQVRDLAVRQIAFRVAR